MLTLAVLILAILWVLITAWVIGAILAVDYQPPAPADPYAADVAEFNKELADWDRRGRPQA